ncbi:hypothetical protein [Lactobacillus kefiranofaciens]|uniref:Uncharacterized protein n=1 Tax=Lactobacillus kefiranofaciens TaxID=267818 RepID=A0AAX3UE33_9LACO|nr:hypothetical protein [Lactobacillus kefiranofaciens]WGO85901.1 hypothetical protein QEJ78_11465 [Lactobacillus kefiranofaciens]WQH36780.1 hypothetical protein U2870_03995 [Lactobacillus kefiranofaciens]
MNIETFITALVVPITVSLVSHILGRLFDKNGLIVITVSTERLGTLNGKSANTASLKLC